MLGPLLIHRAISNVTVSLLGLYLEHCASIIKTEFILLAVKALIPPPNVSDVCWGLSLLFACIFQSIDQQPGASF